MGYILLYEPSPIQNLLALRALKWLSGCTHYSWGNGGNTRTGSAHLASYDLVKESFDTAL